MRRRLLPLLVLLPVLATAGSYTINTTPAQDARLNRARQELIDATCLGRQLGPGCSQERICERAGVSPCTAANARRARVHIPSDVQEFIVTAVVYATLDIEAQEQEEGRVNTCQAFKAASQADKIAICSTLGQPADCTICR